jgi:hypothetical protein
MLVQQIHYAARQSSLPTFHCQQGPFRSRLWFLERELVFFIAHRGRSHHTLLHTPYTCNITTTLNAGMVAKSFAKPHLLIN